MLHYVTLTLNTTFDDISHQFIIPFAVADIKYNILATPFAEEHIRNINIQDLALQFKNHSKDFQIPHRSQHSYQKTIHASPRTFIESIRKRKIGLKPNSTNIAHFTISNYYNFRFSTTPNNQFFT